VRVSRPAHAKPAHIADGVIMESSQTVETPSETDGSAEEHQVRRWRLEQFLRLGFDTTNAAVMAEAKIDLALARQLVGAGCPLETASRIRL
jgi:hypothetical protein